jgi:hypothetical protein
MRLLRLSWLNSGVRFASRQIAATNEHDAHGIIDFANNQRIVILDHGASSFWVRRAEDAPVYHVTPSSAPLLAPLHPAFHAALLAKPKCGAQRSRRTRLVLA